MKAWLHGSLSSMVFGFTLLFASSALAEGEACYNDTDCPNPACGGDVCNWSKTAAKADGQKIFYCQPAGRVAKGMDGWCTTNDNCKCGATGATCVSSHCTDTGTSTATGGSGAGGSGAGGSTSTAGTATAGTATAGATTAGTASKDDGGCSFSAPQQSNDALLALGAVGLGLAFVRRRR
jgi:MYXO-CTERM domain-containing protein